MAGPSRNPNPSFPRSTVLVYGSNVIQSLFPSSLTSQIDSLLDNHRIQDAAELAEQRKRKLEEGGVVGFGGVVREDEADEVRYVSQRIGFQCLAETTFKEAGRYLLAGALDPRVLVSYFPQYRGGLFTVTDSAEVFAGVEECMPKVASIDELIRNYSPHLKPDVRSAPPTSELRALLVDEARNMLEQFLVGWRAMASKDVDVRRTIDTVLARIFAETEKTSELYALIDSTNDILPEVESTLIQNGQYHALCKLYQQNQEDDKLLKAWANIADGEWTDTDVPDPLANVFSFVAEKRDKRLNQKWGIWMARRDVERGMKLLTSSTGKRGAAKAQDDLTLLEQLREVNEDAAAQYLEHLVLQRWSTDRELHVRLATTCVDQLLRWLEDEAVVKLWKAKVSSYASNPPPSTPFLSYFASTTPNSEHKRARLKTVLFLQGSGLYDPGVVRERLEGWERVLVVEVAILEGKMAHHRAALQTLVHVLHDSASAETYCNLGGEVVPARLAQALGEEFGLRGWASLVTGVNVGGKQKSMPVQVGMVRQRTGTVEEETKKGLLRVLVEVYMSEGDGNSERTARLLNAQAVNLDVLDVISLVPPDWPVNLLESFVERSVRRTLHGLHEGEIVKAVSAGENQAVAERSWLVLREQGAIVEEPVEGDEGEGEGEGEKFGEKGAGVEEVVVDEKVGLVLGRMEEKGRDADIR